MRRTKTIRHRGATVVAHDVPMEECPECGTRWLTAGTARALDLRRTGAVP